LDCAGFKKAWFCFKEFAVLIFSFFCIKAKEHKKQINKIYYFLSFAATKRKENKEKSPLHINLLKLYAFYLTQPKPFGNKLKVFQSNFIPSSLQGCLLSPTHDKNHPIS